MPSADQRKSRQLLPHAITGLLDDAKRQLVENHSTELATSTESRTVNSGSTPDKDLLERIETLFKVLRF